MVAPAKRPPEAWQSAKLGETGLGQVIVGRFKASGEAEVGVFLVDRCCLGVKDAYFTRLWADAYQRRLLEELDRREGEVAIEPACARKLVEEAVAYARRPGFDAEHGDPGEGEPSQVAAARQPDPSDPGATL